MQFYDDVLGLSAVSLLETCAFACLDRYPAELVVATGNRVLDAVEEYRKSNPDKSNYMDGGLLGNGEPPLDDFIIAQKLFPPTLHSAWQANILKTAPELMSYIAVVCIKGRSPGRTWLDSALRYAVNGLHARYAVASGRANQMREEIAKLKPLASKGEKFVSGKPNGAAGPLRKAIRRYLSRFPASCAADIWNAFKESPPKGMTVCDNAKFGKYIEYGGNLQGTHYRRFANIVSEEKKRN